MVLKSQAQNFCYTATKVWRQVINLFSNALRVPFKKIVDTVYLLLLHMSETTELRVLF